MVRHQQIRILDVYWQSWSLIFFFVWSAIFSHLGQHSGNLTYTWKSWANSARSYVNPPFQFPSCLWAFHAHETWALLKLCTCFWQCDKLVVVRASDCQIFRYTTWNRGNGNSFDCTSASKWLYCVMCNVSLLMVWIAVHIFQPCWLCHWKQRDSADGHPLVLWEWRHWRFCHAGAGTQGRVQTVCHPDGHYPAATSKLCVITSCSCGCCMEVTAAVDVIGG